MFDDNAKVTRELALLYILCLREDRRKILVESACAGTQITKVTIADMVNILTAQGSVRNMKKYLQQQGFNGAEFDPRTIAENKIKRMHGGNNCHSDKNSKLHNTLELNKRYIENKITDIDCPNTAKRITSLFDVLSGESPAEFGERIYNLLEDYDLSSDPLCLYLENEAELDHIRYVLGELAASGSGEYYKVSARNI